MRNLLLTLIVCFIATTLGFNQQATCIARRRNPSTSLSAVDKDEQWRIQQEMLRRRRDPKAKAAAEAAVDKRRQEASKKVGKNFWNQRVRNDNEDPLVQWKEAMENGEIKDFGYPDEPPKESSLFGLNIPIPQSPIDVPKYDNGERFDLRLPYAERGYVDEDADVMGKISKFFGFGKKKKAGKGEDEE